MYFRRLLLAFASFLFPLCLFAQSEYTKAAIESLKNLDQSSVNSGILYDRVFPSATLSLFSTTDTADYGRFRQAFSELYWASLSQNKRLKPVDFEALTEQKQREGIVPLGVLQAGFQTLKHDALEDDGTGHYRIKAGWSGSIYQANQVNMVALLTPTVSQSPIRVELPWWSTLTLNGAKVSQVQIQVAGNTRTLTPGGSSELLFFNDPGEFVAQYTVSLSDGSSFTARSSVRADVAGGVPSRPGGRVTATLADPIFSAPFPREDDISFIDSVRITADIPFQGYDETNATLGKGDVLYFYGEKRRQVLRPVIILDGFDPRDKRSAHYGLYDRRLSYGTVEENLGDNLRKGLGYNDKHDVILLNFPFYYAPDLNCRTEEMCVRRQFGATKDDIQCLETQMVQICSYRDGGADFIERNAMVLVKLIQQVNQQLQANGSTEKIVLIGPSMGGLISRYALRYMEQNNMNHNTKLWVSFDSPHHGANIAIGVQQFLDFQVNGQDNRGAASNLRDLNSPAAKQMLRHHHLYYKNPTGADNEEARGAPDFRDRFVGVMNGIGFPQASCLRKVALNNGSKTGVTQDFSACTTALNIRAGISKKAGLLCLWVGGAGLCGTAYGLQQNNYLNTAPSNLDRCVVMKYDISGLGAATRYSKGWRSGQLSLDLLPGGQYDVFGEIATGARDASLEWWQEIRGIDTLFSRHSFIPTVSSYALSDFDSTTRNWAAAISDADVPTKTPFSAIYAPNANEEHVTVTALGVAFLKEQLTAANNSQTSCSVVPPTAPLPPGCYTLKAKHSNKFIQPETANAGARLRQQDANGQTNQIFNFEVVDGTAYRVNSQSAGRVVEAANAGSGNATPVVLGNWTGATHQKWTLAAWGDGTYKLSPNHAPGQAFDVEGNFTSNGAGVHLWGQTGGDNQRYFLTSTSCTSTPPPPPTGCDGRVAGLNYKFYHLGALSQLPDFNALMPVQTGTVSEFTIAGRGGRDDQFGFLFEGFVSVPQDGNYRFFTSSDDGSKLFIDGIQRVDNDGLHGFNEVGSGSFFLAAGCHAIRVEMFENGGGEGLQVQWEGPSINKQGLGADRLFRNGTTPPPLGACSLTSIRIYPRKNCCPGRTLGGQIQYSTVGQSGPWVTAYTISNETANTYTDYGFTAISSVKAVRYRSPDGGYGNVAEIEFYNGTAKLGGSFFHDGGGPWNGQSDRTADKAVDDNPDTFYDSANDNGGFVGFVLSGCGGGCSAPVPGLSGGGNVCNGATIPLTASGCSGIYHWSNGVNGVSQITVGAAGPYSVTCEQGGCTSGSSAQITVTANCGGGGCVVNRLRYQFRNAGDCCMDRLVGGKIQGSNDQSNWNDLYTFSENGNGTWQEKTFANSTAYGYVRFVAGPNGYGEFHELEFYNGSTKLVGSAFGSAGTDGSNGYGAAFDGNLSTQWHGTFPGSNNYAGLQLTGCGGGGRQAAGEAFAAEPTEPKGLQLVPNPASDFVELRLPTGERVRRVQGYDLQGRVVCESEQSRLFVGRLPGGAYLIRVETGAGRVYSRVLLKP